MATVSWPGYEALQAKLRGIANPDPRPMLFEWRQIIEEDNRIGVLNGTDCHDQPMAPVTYRPKPPGAKKTTRKQRNNVAANARGVFAGMGPHPAGDNNNLTSAEYRILGGAPLAPRGAHSRVVTNLLTEHDWDPATNQGFAVGRWFDVVSKKGFAFLHAHFEGEGRLPKRDLRGLRSWGMQRAQEAMRRWAKGLLGR